MRYYPDSLFPHLYDPANQMKRVSILTPSDEPAWQAYVNSHQHATIYHTLEWRDILYNEYRFEPIYLIAKEGEAMVGALPMFLIKNLRGKRLVSLPFSIYGGQIGDRVEVVSALIEKSVEIVRNSTASSLEIRPYKPINVDIPALVSSEWGVGTIIDLSIGIEGLWKRLTNRRNIHRAVREGLKFSVSDGEGIEKFYMLQLMTRKRLGLPTPTLRYYKSFFEKMPGMVKLALVEKENTPVAGGFFFIHKGNVLYVLGASDNRYLHLRPNDLLIWEMIKWSANAGYKAFDLGPTLIYDKGLLHFKEKWGGSVFQVRRYCYPAEAVKERRKGSRLFSVMPLFGAKVIGPKTIRWMA